MSDSSYVSQTRHRRPYSTAGRPPFLDVIDDVWASETLSDDEIDVAQQEAVIAPLLEEGELDIDAIVVSVGSSAVERRRREEGRWNDLALDYFDQGGNAIASHAISSSGPASTGNNSSRQ